MQAVFANRFEVRHYGDLVRVTFRDCEEGLEGPAVAVVMMRAADFEALQKLVVQRPEART